MWLFCYLDSYSHIYNKVEDEGEGQQIAEKEDYSTLILVVSTTNEIKEALWAIVSVVVLCYCEAHYDTNNKAAEVTEVIDICLGQTNLNIEKEDQEDEDDQCEPLHGVRLSKSWPFYYQVWDLWKENWVISVSLWWTKKPLNLILT